MADCDNWPDARLATRTDPDTGQQTVVFLTLPEFTHATTALLADDGAAAGIDQVYALTGACPVRDEAAHLRRRSTAVAVEDDQGV